MEDSLRIEEDLSESISDFERLLDAHAITAPTPPPKPRMLSLDVVRGIAVFGILVVNIESFGLVGAARRDPYISGGDGPWNFGVWLGTVLLADTKFIAIFGMLFGAGMVVAYDSRKARGQSTIFAHYRRMLALLIFGTLHAHYLWDGDILFIYALYGSVLFIFIRMPFMLLFVMGAAGLYIDGVVFDHESWNTHGTYYTGEIEVWRSSWSEQQPYRFMLANNFELAVPVLFAAGGMGYMLLGMSMAKSGFLLGRWPGVIYSVLAAAVFPAGIMLMGTSIDWGPHYGGDAVKQGIYWGSLMVTFGWIAWGIVLAQSGAEWGITKRLAAVGRMALTNYLMHSVICTYIFYGHGFGQFERMNRVELLGVVWGICIFQMIYSTLWLRVFQFGPMEWFWRSLTYMKLQPILARRPPKSEEVSVELFENVGSTDPELSEGTDTHSAESSNGDSLGNG